MASTHAIFSTISFFIKKKMAESDFPIFRSKKRKIEEENELDDPLLDLPLAENLFPDSQPSGSQTVAAEVFDLTLVEPEKEKNEALVVWKKLELKLRIKSEKK
jgi:hypothetical protein